MARRISKQLADIFKEWEEDYAAAKERNMNGERDTPESKQRGDAKAEAPAAEKARDNGIER